MLELYEAFDVCCDSLHALIRMTHSVVQRVYYCVLQDLERETRRGSARGRGGRAPAEALAWNDAAWEVPWHNLVGEVGCSFLLVTCMLSPLAVHFSPDILPADCCFTILTVHFGVFSVG